MSASTNSTPDFMKPVSVDDLTRAIEKLASLPKRNEWIVVDPQGRMYAGTVEQVLPLLVNAHPLMRSVPITTQFAETNDTKGSAP